MEKIRYFQSAATMRELLDHIEATRKHFYHCVLKTCIAEGWFTDGRLLTKLTEDERIEFARKHDASKSVSEAKTLEIKNVMPKRVTLMLSFVEAREEIYPHPPLVVMEASGGHKVYLLTDLYQFLTKRHPKATFYLTDEENKIALSERNTVAVIMQYSKAFQIL